MCRAAFDGVQRVACVESSLEMGRISLLAGALPSASLIWQVPSLKDDPDAWFRCVDVEGNGQLTRTQVQEVLVTQFPLDVTKFEEAMETLWPRWDHDLSGYVTREEFLSPESGLLSDVRTQLLKMPQQPPQPVPNISTERLKWFEHFDPAGAGALSQEAVVRGLIKTYGLGSDLAQVQQMRTLVGAIWGIFDSDGSGRVSREEFLKPGDGLADAIIAGFSH